MYTIFSYILIGIGMLITAFGGFFLGVESLHPVFEWLGQKIGLMSILLFSVLPGTLLVWGGGLFGRLAMKKWVRTTLILIYILSVLVSMGLIWIMYQLLENGFS